MNKNEIIIVRENNGLLDFLLANIKNKSKNNIKSLLKNGNILVNNKVITKHDYPLKENDEIKIMYYVNVNDNFKIDIIFEDNDIIVINKPAGLLSMASDNEWERTAYTLVSSYLKSKNKHNKVFIVHRLDKDTSGVLLFAKSEAIKEALQNSWDEIVRIRSYIAIVEGHPSQASGTIKSWLKETTTQLVYSSNKPGDGKEAITNYNIIRSNGKFSMLEVIITTGRKNQIRVHMKDIGHSIIGDKKYGSNCDPIKRLGLHANILELINPISKKIWHFETKVPDSFNKLF